MKNDITITVTISGPVTDGIQSFLSQNGIAAGDLGTMLQLLVSNFTARNDAPSHSPSGRKKARAGRAENHGPGELIQYGREIQVTETIPLTVGALCKYLGYSRSTVSADILRGYAMEFGDRTSAGHYLAWLRKNPKIRKVSENRRRLDKELAALK